ncbi:MAG: TraR/DksA family transcriptional regulator [Cytophagales bacterium]
MAKSVKKKAAKQANKAKKVAKAPTKKVFAKAKPAKSPKKAAPKVAAKPAKKEKPVKATAKKEAKVVVNTSEVRTSKPAAPPLKLSPSQLNIFPILNQRPIAHKPAKPSTTSDDKTRYSDEELKEFEVMIKEKLEKAKEEFKILKDTLTRTNEEGTDSTSGGNTKVLEDGAETAEKENLSQLAARQQKYITNLENALIRIKNRTYGICSVTGKLISKERLIAVPHTTQSIEAKMMKQD